MQSLLLFTFIVVIIIILLCIALYFPYDQNDSKPIADSDMVLN